MSYIFLSVSLGNIQHFDDDENLYEFLI